MSLSNVGIIQPRCDKTSDIILYSLCIYPYISQLYFYWIKLFLPFHRTPCSRQLPLSSSLGISGITPIYWMNSNPNIVVVSEENITIRPPTSGWGTCSACLSLPATAGLVETHLYSAMALLTLHRLPSISTAPVSSVIHMLCCTHKK